MNLLLLLSGVAFVDYLVIFVGFQRFPCVFVLGIKPMFSHCDSSAHTEAALACPLSGSLLTFVVDDE